MSSLACELHVENGAIGPDLHVVPLLEQAATRDLGASGGSHADSQVTAGASIEAFDDRGPISSLTHVALLLSSLQLRSRGAWMLRWAVSPGARDIAHPRTGWTPHNIDIGGEEEILKTECDFESVGRHCGGSSPRRFSDDSGRRARHSIQTREPPRSGSHSFGSCLHHVCKNRRDGGPIWRPAHPTLRRRPIQPGSELPGHQLCEPRRRSRSPAPRSPRRGSYGPPNPFRGPRTGQPAEPSH